jgi:hypothetical protein
MSNEKKVLWLKQRNQFSIMKEAQKFPKVDLLDVIFEKWHDFS